MSYYFLSSDIDQIDDKIWLGNYEAARNIADLKAKGIKKILSVLDYLQMPEYDKKDFIHKKILIPDFYEENIIQYFGECLNFIKGKERILVHCMAGASRSATIVIAYLMWTQKWKYPEAHKFTQSKRSITSPNDGFIEQLKMFEKLLIENDYNIDKINFKDIKWEVTEEFKKDHFLF